MSCCHASARFRGGSTEGICSKENGSCPPSGTVKAPARRPLSRRPENFRVRAPLVNSNTTWGSAGSGRFVIGRELPPPNEATPLSGVDRGDDRSVGILNLAFPDADQLLRSC